MNSNWETKMNDFDDNLNIQIHAANNDSIDKLLLQNLKTRFTRGVIYTFTGKLLIAVNPMKSIDIFSEETMKAYRLQQSRGSMPPHIFSIGADAINALKEQNTPQCVIITGESGSGKTHTTQHLTQFICQNSPNQGNIMKQASTAMNLLDIFGNAETPENKNSSRFVKFLQIKCNSKYEATNIHVSYQLLEVSRLSGETTFGFNFHVFYMLVFQSPIKLKKSLGLNDQHFQVLKGGESHLPSQYSFDDLDQSLTNIGLVESAKDSVYKVLAAILHLCNLEFDEDVCQHAVISNDAPLNTAAKLLKLSSDELKHALTNRQFKTRAEVSFISVPLSRCSSMRCRDSMVQVMYKQLFQFLVDTMNKSVPEQPSNSPYIAILDIAGFECHVKGENSFEQICINYVNETIQQFCIRKLIKDELEWYAADSIDMSEVVFLDNENILRLFEHKTDGIWTLLEDESKKPKPSNTSFFQNIKTMCSTNPAFVLPKLSTDSNRFVIRHFSKDVCYSSENFVEKNTQFKSEKIFEIIQRSMAEFIDNDKPNQMNDLKSISMSLKNDLGKFITKLNENDSHFIRCIKSNNCGLSDLFDDKIVDSQLKANSIAPYINLMQKGYPTRITYADVLPDFGTYLPKDAIENQQKLAKYLLLAIGHEEIDFKVGATHVFLRPGKNTLIDQYNMSGEAAIKDLASKIEDQITNEIRQKEAQKHANEKVEMNEEVPSGSLKIEGANLHTSTEGKACITTKKRRRVNERSKNSSNININSKIEHMPYQDDEKKKSASRCITTKKGRSVNERSKNSSNININSKIEHMPYQDDVKKKSASRCKFPKCKFFTYVFCKECGKYFCFTRKRNCYSAYHTKIL